MYYEIIESEGTVVTEYPENKKPDKTTFPMRNRIVSGLSVGVLVVEAGYRSGTTITAKLAQKQFKTVFCVPNTIDSKYGIGTNNLIKEGAKLVTTSDEIIQYYQNILPLRNIKTKEIKEEYIEIYEIIKEGPTSIHNIVAKSGKDISKINELLTMMQLEELIIKLPGKEYKVIE